MTLNQPKSRTTALRLADLELDVRELTMRLFGGVNQHPRETDAIQTLTNTVANLKAELDRVLRDRDEKWMIRHDDATLRLESLEKDRASYELLRDSLGPLWMIQTGQIRPITLLSTEHLENILAGNLKATIRGAIISELQRREDSAAWRKPMSLWERVRAAFKALRSRRRTEI